MTTQTQTPLNEFPVTWPNPGDANMFWQVERMHWPDPMTPMDFEYMRDAHDQFTWAFASYGVPLQYIPRHINYRWYYSVMPRIEDMSEMPARMQAGLESIEETIPRLRELWNDEWLPEVKQHLAFWETFDLKNASMPELLAHLAETNDRHNRVWQIHFLQTFPIYMAMSTFDDLYQDLFGAENGLDAYRLMQGFDNNTVRMGHEFWRLSEQARRSPVLTAALEELNASKVIAMLEQSDEGRAFLEDFRTFLDFYGHRGDKLGVSFVSWVENPSQAIRQLQDYMNQSEIDVETQMAKLVEEREKALADARAAIKGYPQPIINKFESMLDYAQQATIISEDHTLYIDFGAEYQVRQVLLEFGRRFTAAGILNDPEDIFLLTRPELQETAERLPQIDRKDIVAERRVEMEHFRHIAPPPVLGTLPSEPPPDDPLSRTIGKFFGAPPSEPEGSPDGVVLRGGSGSSGIVRGIARVILTLEDADKLAKGDILVATTTAPTWTPLFASAAAVVTDTGGVLSHCAVVAREYGIPAVVGTGMATVLVRDGELIEVDGDRGIVRVVQGG